MASLDRQSLLPHPSMLAPGKPALGAAAGPRGLTFTVLRCPAQLCPALTGRSSAAGPSVAELGLRFCASLLLPYGLASAFSSLLTVFLTYILVCFIRRFFHVCFVVKCVWFKFLVMCVV